MTSAWNGWPAQKGDAALICLGRHRCDVVVAMLRTRQPCHPACCTTTLAPAT
jgi:hypothetical protein